MLSLSLRRWPLSPLLVLLVGVAIAAIALQAFLSQSALLERRALDGLQTVADLKAAAIQRVLDDQRARDITLSHAPILLDLLQRVAAAGGPIEDPRIVAFLEQACAAAGLDNIVLTDVRGEVVLAARRPAGGPAWSDGARRAMATGGVAFIDFHDHVEMGEIDFGFAAPVIAPDRGGAVMGAVILDIANPTFLDPKLTVWPAAGTGQIELVRVEGEEVFHLGQAAGAGGKVALTRRADWPGSTTNRLMSGETSPLSGTDRYDTPVLAAIAPVPGLGWHLLAHTARASALDEVTRLGIAVAALILVVLVASVASAFYLEQRRRLRQAWADIERDRKMHAAEAQVAAVFDQAAVGIAMVAPTGALLRVNRRLCDMIGYDEATLLTRSILDITHPDDVEESRERLRRSLAQVEHFGFEKRYLHRDGSIVEAAQFVRVVRDADGAPAYFLSVLEDVTERKRAEHQLRNSELRFRHVVESSPNAIVMSDRAGRIVMVNRQAETLLGRAREALVGALVETLLFERQHGGLVGRHVDPTMPASDADPDLYCVRPDGAEIPIEIGLTPIETEAGEMVLATIVDISARRRSEDALRKSQEQLLQAQKMDAIGQLTGGLAHDFNNLLAVILGNLGLIQTDRSVHAEAEVLVAEAVDAARRGANLTRSLLAFARRHPLQPQLVEPNELVGRMSEMLRRTLGERIEVVLDLADGVWPIRVDPAQLEAALVNLATNARDAMPKGGRLTIMTANRHLDVDHRVAHPDLTPGDYVMVQVGDTGSGMPPDVMERIFEPFFTTKARGQGTGLGLSMVFGFIKQSGGHIVVDSEVDVGTTFQLYFTRSQNADEEASTPASDAVPRGNGERVLVVEDAPALRRVVMRQLRELGYRAEEAENAAAAIAWLDRGERFDVLFSDVVMAGSADGFDLARAFAARAPETRIVLTSGFPGVEVSREPALTQVQLLSKPYLRTELARVLRRALTARIAAAALADD